MPSLARDAAIRNIGARNGELSDKRAPRTPLIEIFAQNVFNDTVQRQRLPKATYKALQRIRASGEMLDLSIADAVANAMRDWAVERGATHFTHWFQPMTGLTAEKHDSFLTLTGDDRIINEFSGTSLVKGEPDASSFPSGGLRSTFEARGYTVWDPTSPAILREGPDGLTLLIPTTFCSWTGEALDKKTPLLRSDQAISKAATRLVNLLGNDRVERVFSTIGCEQEYFLIDREFVQLRPDLLSSGRTLFGAKPPKGQELDDHYFGAISQRALGFMQDVERELWKLGIPITTRHNEVAPLQFEFAPIYRPSAVAVDQNMLTMEILKKIADRHGFKCLLHEKPFAGVNGSGKHMNWSLEDNLGNNLLDPGTTPHDNAQFMLFLTAIIRAVHLHGDLMRVAIAHAGNDHRLGANEAPPAIISIFLGAELEEIVQALIDERPPKTASDHALRLGLDSLPEIPKDATDRNRTSPFAFTGQKFEFRAVGSSQSAAYPATFLNTVVAESIDYLCDEIEKKRSQTDSRRIVGTLVTETLRRHQAILFSGDNYSEKWEVMAVKERKLPNLKGTPAALAQFGTPENAALFSKMNVFSERETASRQNVLYETYTSAIRIEALSTYELGQTSILPAAMKHQGLFADSILKTKQACPDLNLDTEEAMLTEISRIITALKKGLDDLRSRLDHLEESQGSEADHAIACRNEIIPSMDFVREQGDRLETLIDDDLWPLPKYREMLFIH